MIEAAQEAPSDLAARGVRVWRIASGSWGLSIKAKRYSNMKSRRDAIQIARGILTLEREAWG